MIPSPPWPKRVFGVLSSQIGYERDGPKHILVRSSDRTTVADGTPFSVIDADGDERLAGTLVYWGERWHSHWWIADCTALRDAGEGHRLRFARSDGQPAASDPFDVGAGLLWSRCFEHVALGNLERRARFAQMKTGWFDAGMPWQEANAHGSMIAGLLDVLEHAADRLTPDQRARLEKQVLVGCDYLNLLQDEAASRGLPAGAISHMKPRFEDEAIPADASKAAVAWAKAARLLSDASGIDRDGLRRRASAALDYCLQARPDNTIGFEPHQRGLAPDYRPPQGQAMTRELFAQAWACIELFRQGEAERLATAASLIAAALERQARPDEQIDGLHGFFFEFDDRHHAEPAWAHQIKDRPIGVDAGATFPNWVLPVIELLRLCPNHADAGRWRAALEAFARGYLVPGCRRNPFGIVPLMVHREHGPIFFAGPWHGMNCIYGLTAALALDLHTLLGDPALAEIATANVQWLAGLNAGVTAEALTACHQFSADLPAGVALPASMVFGVGRRCAGGWTNMRGSVCNGFAIGDQFQFDVPVSAGTDGPHQLTDEDWIPHGAGLLSALARMGAA